ncbi:MAG TPA: ABC transporter ATP-binding protein [Acidimicrobiia bacterium]|nr:ABC transporter ATP-binding protein [Acidimicrobiia bacterium]
MIGWREVSVSFGGPPVVGPLSLTVVDGEWLGLIGPNGAGKSTLLKAAVGVVEHTGAIDLGGRASRAGLDIAWMPQRPHLPDEMTVTDYVLLGRTPHLGRFGTERGRDLDSVQRSLERLDLVELSGRALATLSGGEAQRAVLARALAQEAPVLLLDEPTSNLDIGHALDVLEIIDGLRKHDGLTVVTALHDLTLAGRFADRLVLLAEGKVVTDGGPREVLTEEHLEAYYGAGIRVVDNGDGPTVIPSRKRRV